MKAELPVRRRLKRRMVAEARHVWLKTSVVRRRSEDLIAGNGNEVLPDLGQYRRCQEVAAVLAAEMAACDHPTDPAPRTIIGRMVGTPHNNGLNRTE